MASNKQEMICASCLTQIIPSSTCILCKSAISSQQSTSWKKILYEKQPFPDNHVDSSFLSSMVTNANLRRPRFRGLAFDTLVISQQISVVVCFLQVFYYFFNGHLSVKWLIVIDAVLLFVGFALRSLMEEEIDMEIDKLRLFGSYIASNVKRLFVFITILLALSPVLKTLTSSFSSDTIYALTMVFCGLHVFLHDYSYVSVPDSRTNFQGTISLNASIFASVLLASRLPSSLHVFAIVLCAFEVFAGFPILARSIKGFSNDLHMLFSFGVIFLTLFSLFNLSYVIAFAYALGMLFVSVICPFWLKWIQRYKNAIQGPWDYDTENEVPGD